MVPESHPVFTKVVVNLDHMLRPKHNWLYLKDTHVYSIFKSKWYV